MDNVRSGWRRALDNTAPEPPAKIRRTSKRTAVVLPSSTHPVVNSIKGTFHWWSSGTLTLYEAYTCGTPSEPSSSAAFLTTTDETGWQRCMECWRRRGQ